MINVNPHTLGFFFGGLIGMYALSLLFRYALLGRNANSAQQIWVIALTGVVAIGFLGFGAGTGGFVQRITNPPDRVEATIYALCALIVALFAWIRIPKERSPDGKPKSGGLVGRAVALVIVVPMIAIGLGNLAGSAFSNADNVSSVIAGSVPSPAKMRQILLSGEMAPFWQMVHEKAPQDLDFIVDELVAESKNANSEDEILAKLNNELLNYRISLAAYAPKLTDAQRRAIISNTGDIARALRDDPKSCAAFVLKGGLGLSQAKLRAIKTVFNRTMTDNLEMLIDARDATSGSASIPAAPSQNDYSQLGDFLNVSGITEDQVMAITNLDASDPGYLCDATIGYYNAVGDFQGPAAERIRYETVQLLLTLPAPQ